MRILAATARMTFALGAVAALAGVAVLGVLHARGFELIAVRGASMTPALPLGSLVLAERAPATEIRWGDIVLVRQRTLGQSATPFLHRVVALDRDGGRPVAETKGDANAKRDPTPYLLPEVVLRTRAHVPHAGYAAAAAAGPYGRMAALALLVLLLTTVALRHLFRKPDERDAVAAPVATEVYR